MILKAGGFCLLFLWQAQQLLSQDLKLVSLDEVTVYGSKISEGEVGVNTRFMDSLLLSQSQGENFAQLFRRTGAGQIRSYGVSGLTTPSFRGTSGSQTSVLWNGIRLNSSLNGSVDLSQIPVSSVDQIKIQKGGASSLYGSGAIGGTIQLDSPPAFDDQTTFRFFDEIGSFGRHSYQFHLRKSSPKENVSIMYYHQAIENDFPFLNKYKRGDQVETRVNSGYQQSGLIHNMDFRMGKNQVIGLKLWTQSNYYEVPNSILVSDDASTEQRDKTIRSLVHWSYGDSSHLFIYKQAFIYHHLRFIDSSAQIDSKTLFGAWTNRFEYAFDVSSKISFLLGVNHLYEYTSEENFGSNPPDRNTTSLFGSFKFKPGSKTMLALNIRQERSDEERAFFAPSLGIEHKLNSLMSVKGNISRNYRLPTFNDLYWKGKGGFGNPSLLPESSWGGELAIDLTGKKIFEYNFQITAYSHSVDNWILWRPVSFQDWSPDNVKKVWARGLELDAGFRKKIHSANLLIDLSYRFIRTTNEGISFKNFIREQGKQLSYTPIHEFVPRMTVNARRYKFQIGYNYVGKQFSDGENNEVFALAAYGIWDSSVEYRFSHKKLETRIHFKADNIMNANYENRRGYPMYGRNFSLGVTIQIRSDK